jgi:hypothetical protein
MPIASFLQPLQSVTPSIPLASAQQNPLGGTAAGSNSLPGFSVQLQLQTQWCWAAVSASVADFFGSNLWPQCQVAAAEFAPLNCCGADGPLGCNNPWYLDKALTRVGHFDRRTTPNAPFSSVQSEINGGRPLGCRIAWSGNTGGHFMAIGGWLVASDGTQFVDVYDPIYQFNQMPYVDFCSSYRSPGDTWTHSYFTK